jgi:hypothetical protein
MTGLLLLAALLAYLLIAMIGAIMMFRVAARRGKSPAIARLWAVAMAALILAPVFWDAIPTYVAFKYYSDKYAGLTVRKTASQWKEENPNVAEKLEPFGIWRKDERGKSMAMDNGKIRNFLNERFYIDRQHERLFLTVGRTRMTLRDSKQHELIAEFVGVGSGNPGGTAQGGAGWWKPWLVHARAQSRREQEEFERLSNQFMHIREQK